MITINKSLTADSRTCDFANVPKPQLISSTYQHISDVTMGMQFFCSMLNAAANNHDRDKITNIDQFYADFKTDFKNHTWYDNHKLVNRHHLNSPAGIRDDVNLVDVLEYIVDCVMAGMARSGSVYDITLDADVLVEAFRNTVELFKSEVGVKE